MKAVNNANGNPVNVAHINESCMVGLLTSFKGEFDFSTQTGTLQTSCLLNALGRSVTHSGKKYTHVLWIPFRYEWRNALAFRAALFEMLGVSAGSVVQIAPL